MATRKADIGAILTDSLKRHEAEDRDKRMLRGKHAPPTGVCRVCKGNVVGQINFPTDGRIGGPAPQGVVAYWYCEGCGLMYRTPPKGAK